MYCLFCSDSQFSSELFISDSEGAWCLTWIKESVTQDQADYDANEELHWVGHRYQHSQVARAHIDSVHQDDQH